MRNPSIISDQTRIDLSPDGDLSIKAKIVQSNIPTLRAAEFLRLATDHGWTMGREVKILGVASFGEIRSAEDAGFDFSNINDTKRFLAINPEFAVEAPRRI